MFFTLLILFQEYAGQVVSRENIHHSTITQDFINTVRRGPFSVF